MPCIQVYGKSINLTFVHIPKCAGTSVQRWMRTNRGMNRWYGWNGHPTLSQMRFDRPDIKDTFVVIRNPWERVVSYWAMMKDVFESSEFIRSVISYQEWPTFKKFVLDLELTYNHQSYNELKDLAKKDAIALSPDGNYEGGKQDRSLRFMQNPLYAKQMPISWISSELAVSGSAWYFFYTIQDTQISWMSGETPTFVLRQEKLAEDFKQIQDIFDCQIPLSVENISPHEYYRDYYDAETRDIVARWHARDIEMFGYDL